MPPSLVLILLVRTVVYFPSYLLPRRLRTPLNVFGRSSSPSLGVFPVILWSGFLL